MASDELFDLVTPDGAVIGRATRARCHADPKLLHRAVHLFVFDRAGRVFLQRRSARKDIQPGRWDTSVGGHVGLGESFDAALRREAAEELGLGDLGALELELLHQYVWRSEVESELVRTYRCTCEGPFRLDPEEIEEGAFFDADELRRLLDSGTVTPNLRHELGLLGIAPAPLAAPLGAPSPRSSSAPR